MTLFTQEDLLLYLYKETSPTQSAAIKAALSEDWDLRNEFEVLKGSMDRLDTALESPRTEAILRVLNYAKEAESVTTS